METMGDRLKMLREARGWTQDELAKRLKQDYGITVSRAAISQWEHDVTKNVKNQTFRALEMLFETTQDYLMFGSSVPQRDSNGRFGKRPPAARSGSNGGNQSK